MSMLSYMGTSLCGNNNDRMNNLPCRIGCLNKQAYRELRLRKACATSKILEIRHLFADKKIRECVVGYAYCMMPWHFCRNVKLDSLQ